MWSERSGLAERRRICTLTHEAVNRTPKHREPAGQIAADGLEVIRNDAPFQL